MKGNARCLLRPSRSVPSITSLLLLWSKIPAPAAAVGSRELCVEAPFSLLCLEGAGARKEPGGKSGVFSVVVQDVFCT